MRGRCDRTGCLDRSSLAARRHPHSDCIALRGHAAVEGGVVTALDLLVVGLQLVGILGRGVHLFGDGLRARSVRAMQPRRSASNAACDFPAPAVTGTVGPISLVQDRAPARPGRRAREAARARDSHDPERAGLAVEPSSTQRHMDDDVAFLDIEGVVDRVFLCIGGKHLAGADPA